MLVRAKHLHISTFMQLSLHVSSLNSGLAQAEKLESKRPLHVNNVCHVAEDRRQPPRFIGLLLEPARNEPSSNPVTVLEKTS